MLDNKISRPIFIIGSQRSGTRLLYNLLAFHPDVCWFSTLSDMLPSFPQISGIHRLLDIPGIGGLIKRRMLQAMMHTVPHHLLLSPREGSHIYDDYCGFVDDRKTTEFDKTRDLEVKFKFSIRTHLGMTGKPRFLTKQPPNVQRMRLLNFMFPDAYFVHIVRDGRAVANSLLRAPWWSSMQLWWLRGKRPSEVSNYSYNPIQLCAMHWKKTIEEVRKNRKLLGDRYIEIYYEDLVKDVSRSLNFVMERCELRVDSDYLNLLPKTFQNQNSRWKQDLTKSQQQIAIKMMHSTLKQMNYIHK